MPRPRLLGVLLCYNDGDMLAESLEHLLNNQHDLVVWNHGSTDETATVLARFKHQLLEVTNISREVDFYDLYPLMSKHLLTQYVSRYDWISWPDQDELLEGPTREKSYSAYLEEAVASRHSWIEFHDFVYWFTEGDDPAIASTTARVRHYSLARHGSPKIRSWRASATNIRWFNHNKAEGSKYPAMFNLRHYPMRSAAQMQRRLAVDRAGLQRGPVNHHYENMKSKQPALHIQASELHYDDGAAELDRAMKFNWTDIYGKGPAMPIDVLESYLLPTRRWEIAVTLKKSLAALPADVVSHHGRARIDRWLDALDARISCPPLVALKKQDVKIVTEALSEEWASSPESARLAALALPAATRSIEAMLDTVPVMVEADTNARSIRVVCRDTGSPAADETLPLVALVPCYGKESPRLAAFVRGVVEFRDLTGIYYYLASEPHAGSDRASVHANTVMTMPAARPDRR
jgi:hypothetical protein